MNAIDMVKNKDCKFYLSVQVLRGMISNLLQKDMRILCMQDLGVDQIRMIS